MVLRNVLININKYDKYDMNIMNIKRFIKDIMVLLDGTRLHNTLRIYVILIIIYYTLILLPIKI